MSAHKFRDQEPSPKGEGDVCHHFSGFESGFPFARIEVHLFDDPTCNEKNSSDKYRSRYEKLSEIHYSIDRITKFNRHLFLREIHTYLDLIIPVACLFFGIVFGIGIGASLSQFSR